MSCRGGGEAAQGQHVSMLPSMLQCCTATRRHFCACREQAPSFFSQPRFKCGPQVSATLTPFPPKSYEWLTITLAWGSFERCLSLSSRAVRIGSPCHRWAGTVPQRFLVVQPSAHHIATMCETSGTQKFGTVSSWSHPRFQSDGDEAVSNLTIRCCLE